MFAWNKVNIRDGGCSLFSMTAQSSVLNPFTGVKKCLVALSVPSFHIYDEHKCVSRLYSMLKPIQRRYQSGENQVLKYTFMFSKGEALCWNNGCSLLLIIHCMRRRMLIVFLLLYLSIWVLCSISMYVQYIQFPCLLLSNVRC